MSASRKKHVQRKGGKNTYGGTELDWLHLNSLDLINDGELIVSSREESSLVKVSNIYKKPKIKYIIHSGSLYKRHRLQSIFSSGPVSNLSVMPVSIRLL